MKTLAISKIRYKVRHLPPPFIIPSFLPVFFTRNQSDAECSTEQLAGIDVDAEEADPVLKDMLGTLIAFL